MKMPHAGPVVAALLLLLLCGSRAAAQEERGSSELLVGVLTDWPPSYTLDPDGEPDGFAVDVMEEVARRAGFRTRYVTYSTFPRLIRALGRGDVDIVPNLGQVTSRGAEREPAYTRAYETHPIRLFVRSSTPDVDSLPDLAGRPLGVVESNVGVSIVRERPDLEAVVLPDVRNALFQLLAGEIDGLIYPEPVVRHLARNASLLDEIRAVGEPLREVRRAIAVAPERAPAILRPLDSALAEVVGSPEFSRIYRRWHAAPQSFWTTWTILSGAGALLVLVILGMALWRHVSVLRLNRRLKRQEARFRSLVEGLGEGVMIVDLEEGGIEYVNRRCAEILGYEPSELKSLRAGDLLAPGTDASRVADRLENRSRGRSENYETRLLRKDGEEVFVEVNASPYRVDGEVVGSLNALSDITGRKETERALREREEQLRQAQKMEAVGRLAGGVAHDFNNLLTVIRAHSDFLLLDVEESDPIVEEVLAIQDAAARASRLTNQLLAFGREQLLRPRIVDLNDVVRGTESLLRRIIGEDIRIEATLRPDLSPIRVDPGQVEQVVMNLAVNARDAMPKGGTLALVTDEEEVGVEEAASRLELEAGRYVRLAVSDTGIGMDRETRNRIFDPFFSTKEKEEGTGLGLAMAYGIMRQSGGGIQVESEPGKGSTFILRFPAAGGQPGNVPARESGGEGSRRPEGEHDREPGESVPGRRLEEERVDASDEGASGPMESDPGEKILVVEDDESVRRVVRRLLERAGFSVRAVESAEEGLEILRARNRPPDLVLTDLVLPGVSGRDLVEEVSERFPDVALVVMSGYAEGSPDHRGDLPDEIGFIRKPLTPDALVATIRSALSGES